MSTLRITAEFTHDEKSLKYFDAALKEFFGAVLTLGFTKAECYVEDDASPGPITDLSLEPLMAPESAPEAEPEPEARPLNLVEIRARIREEKAATGGNKILSQTELAERIGVSRARIRQALK